MINIQVQCHFSIFMLESGRGPFVILLLIFFVIMKIYENKINLKNDKNAINLIILRRNSNYLVFPSLYISIIVRHYLLNAENVKKTT